MEHTVALPHRPARRSFVARILEALLLQKSRRDLGALDAHMLRDIGLTPEQAAREAMRPLWDAPTGWKQAD